MVTMIMYGSIYQCEEVDSVVPKWETRRFELRFHFLLISVHFTYGLWWVRYLKEKAQRATLISSLLFDGRKEFSEEMYGRL